MNAAAFGAQVDIVQADRFFPETGLVVERLDLRISPGEFVSLLGPSGCGKSTLLRLIAGLDRPDHGRVDVQTESQTESQVTAFRGFVFQDAQLLPWRTVLENAGLPLELMRRPKSEVSEIARAALEQVGLGDALEKFPAQLSGGMKMRVSVARALVARPRLLLLDEPFAALDEQTRFRLQEDLRALWQRSRMTVIFVTHSVSEAAFLSDRSIVLTPRPARVLLDHRLQLSTERNRATRAAPNYLREVEILTQAFQNGEAL